MLPLPRARRRFVLGPALLGPLALGAGALALGCSRGAPPEAPVGTVEPSAAESTSSSDASAAEPSPATVDAEPVASSPEATGSADGTAAPSAGQAPRDARGKEEIQRVMADNRDAVRACYDQALAQNPGIAGDLVVDFTIDPRGDVKQAEVNWSESDLHVPELDTCAVDAVRAIKFPASSRGMESKVSYPFNFKPRRAEPPPAASPDPLPPSKR